MGPTRRDRPLPSERRHSTIRETEELVLDLGIPVLGVEFGRPAPLIETRASPGRPGYVAWGWPTTKLTWSKTSAASSTRGFWSRSHWIRVVSVGLAITCPSTDLILKVRVSLVRVSPSMDSILKVRGLLGQGQVEEPVEPVDPDFRSSDDTPFLRVAAPSARDREAREGATLDSQ